MLRGTTGRRQIIGRSPGWMKAVSVLFLGIAGMLSIGPAFAASVEAIDPSSAVIEWSPWGAEQDRLVLEPVGSTLVPGRAASFVISDLDADGTGEIIVREDGCDGENACAHEILGYDQMNRRWIVELAFTAARPDFQPVRWRDRDHYGLKAGNVIYVYTPQGFVAAMPPVSAEIEGRDPYRDEIDLMESLTDPAKGIPREDLWGRVFELDLDGSGRTGRIIVVTTPTLCARGGICPFYAVNADDGIAARGVSWDEPLLVPRQDGGHDLLAHVAIGYVYHHVPRIVSLEEAAPDEAVVQPDLEPLSRD